MADLQCAVRGLFARHAEAEGGPRLAGDDQPLSARGREQAARLGDRLRADRVAAVYTSPLLRGRQTAQSAAAALGAPVTVDDRLIEFTAGSLDLSPDPRDAQHVTDVFHSWLDGRLDLRVGDGETGHQVVARLSGVLQDVQDAHRGETVLVISHGGLLTLGLTVLSATLNPAWVSGRPLGPADLVEMAYDSAGWVCRAWAGDVPR
jgi:broad specificity phosphatase PhoE